MHQMMKLLDYFFSRMLHLLQVELVQLVQLSHLPTTAPGRGLGGEGESTQARPYRLYARYCGQEPHRQASTLRPTRIHRQRGSAAYNRSDIAQGISSTKALPTRPQMGAGARTAQRGRCDRAHSVARSSKS